MATLSSKDWLRLHELVLDLHTAPDLDTLADRLLAGLRGLFPFEIGYVQNGRRGMRHIREAFFAVSAERHPHTDSDRRTGDGSALRRTVFFNEISRPLGVIHQLTIYLPLPDGGTLTCAAARGGRVNFSGRDRLVLQLVLPHLATAWRRALRVEERPDAARAPRTLCRLGLTPREADVLGWLSQGKTNADIALILAIRPATVKTYVEHILAKLGCETRTAAARAALEVMTPG